MPSVRALLDAGIYLGIEGCARRYSPWALQLPHAIAVGELLPLVLTPVNEG